MARKRPDDAIHDTALSRDERRLMVLVRGLLASEAFETLADLADAVKYDCARLQIPWTPDALTSALRALGQLNPRERRSDAR